MEIGLKRVYEPAADDDGARILTERLWPRGISKEKARIEQWVKDFAPSTELRRWYAHDEQKWPDFQQRYRRELAERGPELKAWAESLRELGRVTFVFGSKGVRISSVVLRDVIQELLRENGEFSAPRGVE